MFLNSKLRNAKQKIYDLKYLCILKNIFLPNHYDESVRDSYHQK